MFNAKFRGVLAAAIYLEEGMLTMMELVCPAGNLPSLKAAVDNGADAAYLGFRDDTNARRFPGLNFDAATAARAVQYAHAAGGRVFVAVNSYAQAGRTTRWTNAIDQAADIGADAVILADIALLEYAATHHPNLARHLSVQSSATNVDALSLYTEAFGIRRAVLPRVLSLMQIERLAANSPVDLEVFGFGSLCIMAEGRCHLSSYLTGESPNRQGICSPAWAVRWDEHDGVLDARLNGVLIDRYGPGEEAAYPTLCKGRFRTSTHTFHALEEPTSLNTLSLLPKLHAAGVRAIKIEGRQRSPGYVAQVAHIWRQALDAFARDPECFAVGDAWQHTLTQLSEGAQTTLGAYHRPWQ